MKLALRKAWAVAAGLGEGVVLGADTLVVVDGEALGKRAMRRTPRPCCAASRALARVITAIAAVDAATGRQAAEAVITRVQMADYTDADIAAYVASGEPLDKAGAYANPGARRGARGRRQRLLHERGGASGGRNPPLLDTLGALTSGHGGARRSGARCSMSSASAGAPWLPSADVRGSATASPAAARRSRARS